MDLVPSIAVLFSRFSRRLSRFKKEPTRNPNPRSLGILGEEAAARHLHKLGYRVLYRNFRAPHGGEVDLVCRHGETLVFVEVKTRRTALHGRPGAAVNLRKQRLIARGALAWLRMLQYPTVPFRFDIVEVVLTPQTLSIEIITDAFQLPEPWSV